MTTPTKIFYQVHSCTTNSIPIIFLSGFGGDHTAWQKVISFLPEQPQKITLDNQGVGQTLLNHHNLTTFDMALDVFNIMDELKIESALIVGHSMGGAIAQEMALYAPMRVRGLVLAGSFAKLDTVASMSLDTRVRVYETDIDMHLKIENSLAWLYGNDFLKNTNNIEFAKNRILQNPFPQTLGGMKAQLKACLSHNTLGRLKNIICPALVIGSKNDILVAFYHSELLAAELKNAKIYVLTNMGHMFIIEHPEIIAEEISLFYKNIME